MEKMKMLKISAWWLMAMLGVALAEELSPEAEMLRFINQERTTQGLGEVKVSPEANAMAQEWAVHLGKIGKLQHRSSGELMSSMSKNGWRGMSENIHKGFGGETPRDIIDAWMKSPVHRANLLNPRTNQIGLGTAAGDDGFSYAVFNGVVAGGVKEPEPKQGVRGDKWDRLRSK